MPKRYTAGKAAALTSRTPSMTKNAHHPVGFQRPYRSIPPGDMFPTAWRRYAVGTQEALTAGHGQPNSATASGPRSWIARLPRLLSLRRCWNFPGSFAEQGAFLRALRPTSNAYEVPGINGYVTARHQATVLIADMTYICRQLRRTKFRASRKAHQPASSETTNKRTLPIIYTCLSAVESCIAVRVPGVYEYRARLP